MKKLTDAINWNGKIPKPLGVLSHGEHIPVLPAKVGTVHYGGKLVAVNIIEPFKSIDMPEDQIPRRHCLDLNTPEELKIRSAINAVEQLGADPILTECVILLSQARERLADYIDRQKHDSD